MFLFLKAYNDKHKKKGLQRSPEWVKEMYLKELKFLSLMATTRFTSTFDLWIQNLL